MFYGEIKVGVVLQFLRGHDIRGVGVCRNMTD